MGNAVKKWSDDILFVNNHRINEQRNVVGNVIERYSSVLLQVNLQQNR